MQIRDGKGREVAEVTLRLSREEVTDLLVAASEIDGGAKNHALVTDPSGGSVALYVDDGELAPLQRGVDWWLGPVLLLVAVLTVIGAFTVARSVLTLLF